MYSFVYFFSLPEDFLETSCFITFLLKIRGNLLLTPKEKKKVAIYCHHGQLSQYERGKWITLSPRKAEQVSTDLTVDGPTMV